MVLIWGISDEVFHRQKTNHQRSALLYHFSCRRNVYAACYTNTDPSPEPSVGNYVEYLRALVSGDIFKLFAWMAVVCRNDGSDYQTYLMRLAERELLDREKRAAERRVREANFPVIKTMDTYNFKSQPSVNERLIRELMRGEYIHKKRKHSAHWESWYRQVASGMRVSLCCLRARTESPLLYCHQTGHRVN